MRQFLAAPRDCASLRLCVISLCTALQTVACARRPPADFAPDPGLIGQIRDIQIIPEHSNACPGATIPATYEAVLADGSRVPFARPVGQHRLVRRGERGTGTRVAVFRD